MACLTNIYLSIPSKYPFIPKEKVVEGSHGETSDKHRCGRTKSHLIQSEGKKRRREPEGIRAVL